MDDWFQGLKAKRHPPPEEKVDPVKVKRTLSALAKPPKSPPKGNYERIIAKTWAKAERSGSTVSDQRLKERRAAGKQIAQLGEQAKQSCPPLKVPRDIVDPRMVPGYCNVHDYLPDDVHYDPMEVQIHKYEYGKPLVKYEKSLTLMMRRLHDWYLKICKESGGGVLCMRELNRSMTSLELNCCLFHLRSSISFSINWPSIKQQSPATVCKYYYFCR